MRIWLQSLCLGLFACVGPEDSPSKVIDLRVLAMSLESPDLMSPTCDVSLASLTVWGQSLDFSALIADPKGEGRPIAWDLSACATPADRTCSGESVLIQSGTTSSGVLKLSIQPGALMLSKDKFLLQRVFELDTFRGLGGIRMPLMLHLQAGEEEIYAQKLMVFSCRYFPDMRQNVTPKLSGLRLDSEEWKEGDVPEVKGETPIEPQDFTALQEAYMVPSFELQPVQLQESWKVAWHSDQGSMSPEETGGTDLGGNPGLHRVKWVPSRKLKEPVNVHVWAVVRDGRGGESWLSRTLRYVP